MRLTKFSDYALRLLLLAASRNDRNVTIQESAGLFDISASHLKKVVRTLSNNGLLVGQRGRTGGFRLALPPEQITLGRVLRITEPDFAMVECFRPNGSCAIALQCELPPVINEALDAFLTVFDNYTLADVQIEGLQIDDWPADGSTR